MKYSFYIIMFRGVVITPKKTSNTMEEQPVVALFIEGTYPWHRGGVSEWVHQYVHAFPELRFEVIQVVTEDEKRFNPHDIVYTLAPNITRFVRITPPKQRENTWPDLTAWYDQWNSTLSEIALNATLVHATNTGFAGWLGARLSAMTGSPLILTEHALYWKEVELGAASLECGYHLPKSPEARQKLTDFFRMIARVVYEQSSAVISVSRTNMEPQKEYGALHAGYIPNGVAEWLFSTGDQRSHMRVVGKPIHIGWVGRCADIKDPLRFFDLVDGFRRKNLKARFTMYLADAGEDRLVERVKLIAEKFPEVELVWNESAVNAYQDLDALCITSKNESQPLVLFEALAAGVLPIGWQVGDADERFGFFVDQNTLVDVLIRMISNLWNKPGGWFDVLEERRVYAKKFHTWTNIFDQYRNLFAPLLVS